jgi:CRP/FNR family transcriptional regulator, cyclic AMP receptor protein
LNGNKVVLTVRWRQQDEQGKDKVKNKVKNPTLAQPARMGHPNAFQRYKDGPPATKNGLSVVISFRREHRKGLGKRRMAQDIEELFDPEVLVRMARSPVALLEYRAEANIFSQGDRADALYYVREGKVKYTVVSKQGKKAVITIYKSGNFFGVGCMAGRPLRLATATAITACSLIRIHRKAMPRLLQGQRKFSEFFVADLLSRTIQFQEELMDCLLNSDEKRLARILLSLAQFRKGSKTGYVVPKLNQQTLAQMVGTTRPRANLFMNKFRKRKFVDYNGELKVHKSLRNVLSAGAGAGRG